MRTALATALLVALITPQAVFGCIDELAFGTSPAVMVYLFAVGEVTHTPDSPYTVRRVANAVIFCRGKVSGFLEDRLIAIKRLLDGKKYGQARQQAKELLNEVFSE